MRGIATTTTDGSRRGATIRRVERRHAAPRFRAMIRPSALAVSSLLLVSACDDHPHQEPIDLGPPRPLIYITDDTAAEKHGGGGASGVVHVFDEATFEHVGSFDGGGGIGEIHATPDGSTVWMLAGTEGTVSLLDTTTYELTELDVGVRPVHSFIASDRSEIYVGNDGSADVSIISLASRSVIATTLTGAGHHKMAVTTDANGAFAGVYVSNITDGTITPVGTDHAARANVAGTGPAPHGMDYSSVTRRVYNCSGDAQHSVEVIATTDEVATVENDRDTVVARIPLDARCSYLHVSDDGTTAYATLPSANLFARIRLSDHHVDTFSTDVGPDKFEIVGTRAYVVHSRSATVWVIDLDGVAATTTIAVGQAVAPGVTSGHRSARFANGRLYVPNAYDGTVSVIDTATDTVLVTLDGMHAPSNIAVAGPGFGTTYPR